MKFLLVSRFEDIRILQKEFVLEEFPQAEFAETERAPAALQHCTDYDFDVVITGMILDEGSGADLAAALSKFTKPPILVLSSIFPVETADKRLFDFSICKADVPAFRNVLKRIRERKAL